MHRYAPLAAVSPFSGSTDGHKFVPATAGMRSDGTRSAVVTALRPVAIGVFTRSQLRPFIDGPSSDVLKPTFVVSNFSARFQHHYFDPFPRSNTFSIG